MSDRTQGNLKSSFQEEILDLPSALHFMYRRQKNVSIKTYPLKKSEPFSSTEWGVVKLSATMTKKTTKDPYNYLSELQLIIAHNMNTAYFHGVYLSIMELHRPCTPFPFTVCKDSDFVVYGKMKIIQIWDNIKITACTVHLNEHPSFIYII